MQTFPHPPGLRLTFWLLLGLCRYVPDALWSCVLLGWPFPNLHPEQLLGGEGFPSHSAGAVPTPMPWGVRRRVLCRGVSSYCRRPQTQNPPARPQPRQSLQLGPQEVWGLGRCWWILGTQQAPLVREQFPALSFTRSVTMGVDEPSQDPPLSSVTCV